MKHKTPEEIFVGREKELGHLLSLYDDVRAGRGRVALVSGGAGIGKTSLINRFVSKIQTDDSCLVVRLLGANMSLASSYLALYIALKIQTNVAMERIDFEKIDEDQAAAFFDSLLRRISDKPFVVFVDDLQFCHPKMLLLIVSLVQRMQSETYPVMVLAAICTNENTNYTSLVVPSFVSRITRIKYSDDVSVAAEVEVSKFRLSDTATLIDRMFSPNHFPNDTANVIHKCSDGSPSAVVNYLQHLVFAGHFAARRNSWYADANYASECDLPLQQLVTQRIHSIEEVANNGGISVGERLKMLFKPLAGLPDAVCTFFGAENMMTDNLRERTISLAKSIAALCNASGKSKYNAELQKLTTFVLSQKRNIRRMSTSVVVLHDDPAHLLSLAEERTAVYAMSEAAEFAHRGVATLDSVNQNTSDTALLYKLLCVEENALSRLGHYTSAVECTVRMRVVANFEGNNLWSAHSYYRMSFNNVCMGNYDVAFENVSQALALLGKKSESVSAKYIDYLILKGRVLFFKNSFAEAEEILSEAARMARASSDKYRVAICSMERGSIARTLGNYQTSRRFLRAAEKFFENSTDKYMYSRSLINHGLLHDAVGRYSAAGKCYEKAVAICLATEDNVTAANCYNNMGLSKYYQSDYPKSLEYYNKALAIDKMLGNMPKVSISYNNIGMSLLNSGDEEGAGKYFNLALGIAKGLQPAQRPELSLTYTNLGALCGQKGEISEAVRYYELAIEVDRVCNDTHSQLSSYNCIGNLYCNHDDYNSAMPYFYKSLEIAERIGDDVSRAAVFNNFGNIYYLQQDYTKACDYYTQALTININNGDTAAAALNYSNIASVYDAQKNCARSETYYDKAIELYHQSNDKMSEAFNLESLASLYYRNEKYNKAKVTYLAAAEIFNDLDNRKGYALSLRCAGDTMRMLCEYKNAEKALLESLEVCQNIGDSDGEAESLSYLASMYSEKPDNNRAVENYKKAAELYRQLNRNVEYADMLSGLALVYSDSNSDEALICYHQAADIYRLADEKRKLASTYTDIGLIYDETDYEKSAENYKLAANYYEMLDDVVCTSEALYLAAMALLHTDKRDEGYLCLVSVITYLKQHIEDNKTDTPETTLEDKLLQSYTALADYFFEQKDYQQAIKMYQEALERSSNTDNHSRTAYLCNNMGYTFDTICLYAQALQYYKKACDEYQKEEFKCEGLFNNLKNVALMSQRIGIKNDAAKYYQQAFDAFENELYISLDQLADCALMTANAIVAVNKANFKVAAIYYQKSYTLYRKDDNLPGMISALYHRAESEISAGLKDNIPGLVAQIMHIYDMATDTDTKCVALKSAGALNYLSGNCAESINKYQQAVDILLARDNWDAAARLYFEMAVQITGDAKLMDKTVSFNGETLSAYDFVTKIYNNAIELAKTEKDVELEIQALASLALYNVFAHEKDVALECMQRALRVAEESGSPEIVAMALIEKSEFLLRFFNDFGIVEECLNRAISLLLAEVSESNLIIYAYAYKFVMYVRKGLYNEADEILKVYDPYFVGVADSLELLHGALVEFARYKSNS